jgi:hypothetical protein
MLCGMVMVIAVLTIGYRGMANAKYLPVLLGTQTKQQFLLSHLNFDFGDFYDEGGAIKHVVGDNTVYVVGGHNLFYADFSFVHETETQSYEAFPFILNLNQTLQEQFAGYKKIYTNERTHAQLFQRE